MHERLRTAEKNQLPSPVSIPADSGEARWWGEGLAVIKATGADTGGQMAIIEITEPPGAEAPLHVHHNEDEAFWIVEGEATFKVGDATIAESAGDYAFGPRDVPHRYRVGASGCRMLFILTPAGFEDLVRLISVPAADRTLPPTPQEPAGLEDLGEVIAGYGCEILDD